MESANPPLLRSIEPGIRPLVDALGSTGLVRTFTSCEGHFGYQAPAGDFTDREHAQVGFFLREDASEDALSRFFGKVLAEYDLRQVREVVFSVDKRYAAALVRTDAPEAFYEFSIRPRDGAASNAAKRRDVDRAIAVITACVNRGAGAHPVEEPATPQGATEARAIALRERSQQGDAVRAAGPGMRSDGFPAQSKPAA